MTLVELLPLLKSAGFTIIAGDTEEPCLIDLPTASSMRELHKRGEMSGADIEVVQIREKLNRQLELVYLDENGWHVLESDDLEAILGFLSKATGHDLAIPRPG